MSDIHNLPYSHFSNFMYQFLSQSGSFATSWAESGMTRVAQMAKDIDKGSAGSVTIGADTVGADTVGADITFAVVVD